MIEIDSLVRTVIQTHAYTDKESMDQPSTDSWLSTERMLLGYTDPVSGPGDHGLGINGSEAKLVTDSQASSVAGPFTSSQAVPI